MKADAFSPVPVRTTTVVSAGLISPASRSSFKAATEVAQVGSTYSLARVSDFRDARILSSLTATVFPPDRHTAAMTWARRTGRLMRYGWRESKWPHGLLPSLKLSVYGRAVGGLGAEQTRQAVDFAGAQQFTEGQVTPQHVAARPGRHDNVLGSSIAYRIAVGPQQVRKVLTLQMLPACDDRFDDGAGKGARFSLHAGVAARADERKKLERLCRYISRPAASEKRLLLTPHGNVRYRLKTPYRDGTTRVLFEPLDFIARLAALVPKPRVNLTRL